MPDTEQFVCKLPVEGRHCMCITKTEWDEKSCTMYLILGNDVWIGSLWEEDVLQLSNDLSLSSEEYFSKTKHVLTCHGGAEGFVYTIDGSKFCWKMKTSSGMSIKYGSVELRSAQVSDVVESIIDSEIEANIQLNEKLNILKKQKEEIESEKIILSEKLDEHCKIKIEMENTLYSKFLIILNEKKKKIRELKEKLKSSEDCEEDEDADKKVAKPVVSDISDHYSSGTDVETDNEMSQTDMIFNTSGTRKGKVISPRKLKYKDVHPEVEGDVPGPSGVKISKPAVKITKAEDNTISNDCDTDKPDVLCTINKSQKMNDSFKNNNSKINNHNGKSNNVFSQDTLKSESFIGSQGYKGLSPTEILSRLVD